MGKLIMTPIYWNKLGNYENENMYIWGSTPPLIL